jgi:hypothetical protein
MIVDTHTQLWTSPDQLGPAMARRLRRRSAQLEERLDASPQAHEQAMQPVAVSIVVGFRSRYLEAEVPTALVVEYIRRHPDRLIGFLGIDPMESGYIDQLDQLQDLGLAGVSISPTGCDFHPSDTRAMRLYEHCCERNLPVIVHMGPFQAAPMRLDYARPYLFDEVARHFPDLRLVIGHCGQVWSDEALMLVDKHEHVYADLSAVVARPWSLYNLLLRAHQQGVVDKLLFGSGFPLCQPQEAIETIYSLNRFTHNTGLPTVPREKLRSIVERDALACLGLARQRAGSYGRPANGSAARSHAEETQG